ncbi:MAG TPA: acyltransferase family protein [Acidimicrobiia bacterium]|nr:acyltransferase family protein [Acidimicrobiia bacterium]
MTEATATPTRTSRPYWPALDGWRGLTIWVAISVHAGYFTAGGVLSLDTFFVLSGFLITGILLREWLRGDERGAGRIDLPAFWARRARRLLPGLFVVLAAVLFYAAFLAPSLGLDRVRGDVISSLFYFANWHFIASGQSYFSTFTAPSPVLHLWSLAVEEQFYLFWPPIVLGVLWLARRRCSATTAIVTVGIVAVVGSIASAVLMASLYVPGGDPSRVYYGTDTRAQAMLIGAALAVIVTLHGPLRSRRARTVLAIAAVPCFVVVALPWFANDATRVHDVFYGQYGLLVYSVATAAVLWRLAQPAPGLLGRGLQLRPFIWIGAISYEMYLWHWPLYLVVTPGRTGLSGLQLLAVRLSVVVVCAALTHFFVAEPIRRGVRIRSPQLARIATAGVVIVLGVGVFAATVSARPMLNGDFGQVADRRSAPSSRAAGSASRPSSGGAASTPASARAPVKVLVVGDSQAVTLAQGFDANPGQTGLSAQPGLVVWDRAILGCSISTYAQYISQGRHLPNICGGPGLWQRQWAGDVASFRPDVVVVQAGAWDVYDVVGPKDTVIPVGSASWMKQYTSDVTHLFAMLGAGGARILAITPPCYGGVLFTKGGNVPPERLDAQRVGAVRTAWDRAARAEGFRLYNLDHTLCPGGRSDDSIRADGAHYTNDGANRVAPIVADAVRAAARRALVAGG